MWEVGPDAAVDEQCITHAGANTRDNEASLISLVEHKEGRHEGNGMKGVVVKFVKKGCISNEVDASDW